MNTRRITTNSSFKDPLFIGFDSILNKLPSQSTNYPPYNLIKTDNHSYIVQIAVAGFDEEDIDITVHDGILSIKGDISTKEGIGEFMHRGIATRNFDRSFTLANTIEVKGARMHNGMLHIELENIIPESKKPKKIAIGGATLKELLTE